MASDQVGVDIGPRRDKSRAFSLVEVELQAMR